MTDKIVSATAPEGSTPPTPTAGELRHGSAGTSHIVAMVVAAAAPIASAATLIPLGMLLGSGIATPGAIALVSLVLALFAVGFVRVLPHIKNTGAFYAYITAGLGRPSGLASAYAITFAYAALGASIIGGFGFFGNNLLNRYFSIDVPWIVCGFVGVIAATALAIAGVVVAGRVLLVILSLELLAVTVVNAAILFQNGVGSFSLQVFNPTNIFSGSVGVAAIYAFVLFLGFEGTAIYTEEAKDPHRTIPRATYWIIGLIGVFYTLTSWSMVAGSGIDRTLPRIAENPGLFMFSLSDQYVGTGWSDIITVLNLLSLFAGIMAFQNAAARYLFALSRDGMLPRALGATHPKLGTPVVGLVLISAIYLVLATCYRLAGLDPLLEMSTSLVGLGTIGLIAMLSLASASIAVFFCRRGDITLTTVVAPALAALLLAYCTAEGIRNYGAITGVKTWWINNLGWLYVPIAVVGLGYAFWVRANRPAAYADIGKTRL